MATSPPTRHFDLLNSSEANSVISFARAVVATTVAKVIKCIGCLHAGVEDQPTKGPAAVHPHRICYRQSAACSCPDKGKTVPCSAPVTAPDRDAQLFHVNHYNQTNFLSRSAAKGARFPLFSASHGVFRVKLIRLRRPLAGHPRSGAKRSGAGSEATLTRQRPDTLSRASAPLRALGCLCGLCRAHSFWHCASPWRLDPKREPVFLDGRITSHPVELVGARTIIPHARGRRARVGGDHPHMGCFGSSSFVCAGRWRVTREAGRSAAEQGAKRP